MFESAQDAEQPSTAYSTLRPVLLCAARKRGVIVHLNKGNDFLPRKIRILLLSMPRFLPGLFYHTYVTMISNLDDTIHFTVSLLSTGLLNQTKVCLIHRWGESAKFLTS
jgi:hypothetical protein